MRQEVDIRYALANVSACTRPRITGVADGQLDVDEM
jgi:hypothetical protein